MDGSVNDKSVFNPLPCACEVKEARTKQQTSKRDTVFFKE